MRSSIRKACVGTDRHVTSANYSSMAPGKKRTRSRVSASPPPELEPKKFQKVNADANRNLADDGNEETVDQNNKDAERSEDADGNQGNDKENVDDHRGAPSSTDTSDDTSVGRVFQDVAGCVIFQLPHT